MKMPFDDGMETSCLTGVLPESYIHQEENPIPVEAIVGVVRKRVRTPD